ncbi:MAG: PDZ domain-containing protein [Actinomycetia bacterium]|nr:PDZ domain-containing protein [Actinomycetes bacterium]
MEILDQPRPSHEPVEPDDRASSPVRGSTVVGTGAAAGRAPDHRFGRNRLRWVLAILGASLLAFGVAANFIEFPYYALSPGSVRNTVDRIDVAGTDVFDPEEDVRFTTVSVRGRVNLWDLARGWIDPAIDIVPEDRILGDRDADENRQVSLQLMSDSKTTAIQVALERLGYDVARETGVIITSFVEGYPAEDVLELGDVILEANGQAVSNNDDIGLLMTDLVPGDEITLTVVPFEGGPERTESFTLAEREDEPGSPFMGVSIQTRVEIELPFPVEIESGDVGGPSAGLAFSLGVLDVLTPGDVTGGVPVAVTGTIDGTGAVGPVGGVAQKTAAVRRAGIDLFIVPATLSDAELAGAIEQAGDDVRIVPVMTLDEALEVLAEYGGDVPPSVG